MGEPVVEHCNSRTRPICFSEQFLISFGDSRKVVQLNLSRESGEEKIAVFPVFLPKIISELG